jgi:type I restriction enzyme S subunit
MSNSNVLCRSIPPDWNETRLEDITRIRRGASPRPIDNPRWFSDRGPGWVRISDVTRANGRLQTTEQCLSQEGVERSVRIGHGDVIMSICATIGEPVVVEIDACIHDGFVVFDQFENSLDRQFLLHLLRKTAPEFKASGQTGTQANLNTGIGGGKIVCIPRSTTEQFRIAAVLDTVDEAIAKTEEVIAKLKQVHAGLLHDILTRGLDEHSQLRDPITHPEQFQDSPLGRVPRAWEIKTCQSVCREIVVVLWYFPEYKIAVISTSYADRSVS